MVYLTHDSKWQASEQAVLKVRFIDVFFAG